MKQSLYFLFLSIISAACTTDGLAQCNISITNLPDTILACKNSSVQLNPNVITTSGIPYYVDTTWSPATGLSNPNIINPVVAVGTTSANYVLTVQAVTPTNLLFNGDFEAGNTGFTSSYIYGTGGTYGLLSLEGQFAIATNPNNTHVNFANFGDHTSGSGNMLVVNGAGTANVSIWCQTINVNPNTWYDFSAWGATCVASNPAILQFSINGMLTGTPLALPLTNGLWTQFHTTWFSGANTTINICITDQATATSGNDFAIDDIAFKEICTIQDSVYIKTINLTPTFTLVKQLGCDQDTVKFSAQSLPGNTPSTYNWSFGDFSFATTKNPTHIYQNQGTYSVKLVTTLNGCSDSTTQIINISHPIDAVIGISKDSVCLGESIIATSVSTPSGFVISTWNWGDGTITTGTISGHSYAAPGSYIIKLSIVDTLGCTDSTSRNIFVDNPPYVDFSISDSSICVGESIFFADTLAPYTQSFAWDFGDGIIESNIHHPKHTWDKPGTPNPIKITLIGSYLVCPDLVIEKWISVNEYPNINLGRDTMICPGITGSIYLTDINGTLSNYTWSTGEIGPGITITEPGHYWVKATNGECSTTDSIWIKRDCYLNIPNSFSPNNDGLNDYFIPREILSSGLKSFKMSIFNRWGELIFTTNKLDGRGWDGKYNNMMQAVGVYVYTIDVVYNNAVKKTFTGNVTLLR